MSLSTAYIKIQEILDRRILLLDGAMGTMISMQADLCPDALCLTSPETISDIHRKYLEAGADIITTNTFNANAVSLNNWGLSDRAYGIAYAGARVAREEADRMTALTPEQSRFVAGSIGPTCKKASISDGAVILGNHDVPFDELTEAYAMQIEALLDGGADILLIETVWNLLNAKAALTAIQGVEKKCGMKFPVMVSAVMSSETDKILSGESLEEFYSTVKPYRPLSVGINCSNGADGLLANLRRLSEIAECRVSCHPNAGLPDANGNYAETPESFANVFKDYLEEGIINIIGGCCGTTPAHIGALKRLLS